MIVSIPSLANYDIMKPAFAQDLAFAEPEEDKNGGSHDKEANKDHPDFNFVQPVILDVVMRLKELSTI